MSNIKKFRIKSFKQVNSVLELNQISLKFGKKIILDNLNLKLNNPLYNIWIFQFSENKSILGLLHLKLQKPFKRYVFQAFFMRGF